MEIIYPPKVGSTNLTDGSVTATDLADGAVGTAKLATGAVTTPKVAAGAITGAKIAADALRILGFTGLASSGDITLSVDPGDVLLQVLDADNFPYGSSFDTPITVANILRQNENSDFSTKAFVAFVLRRAS
jgi:hypothetical protein